MFGGSLLLVVSLVFMVVVLVVAFAALARVATPLGVVLALVVFVALVVTVGWVYHDVFASRARNTAKEIERMEKLLGPGRNVPPVIK